MYDFIADLILHFLIMMMIPFAHKLISRRGVRMRIASPFLSVLILVLFLTIAFPVEIAGSQFFDLKFIPVFVAFFTLALSQAF